MTDDELAEWLGIARAKEREAIFAALTPEQRTAYEQMAETYTDIMLWQQGLRPRPPGVIVCREKRGGRGHRCT